MGNCLGHSDNGGESGGVGGQNRKKVVAKGQPLKKDKLKWKSDVPLTTFHITAKRDEFWDTAPAFEGRQEIWDALKAAVEAVEKGDYELAQAIIDGANIILPSGTLRDCYDELGNRYQLPLYVLGLPSNLCNPAPATDDGGGVLLHSQDSQIPSASSGQSSRKIKRSGRKQHKQQQPQGVERQHKATTGSDMSGCGIENGGGSACAAAAAVATASGDKHHQFGLRTTTDVVGRQQQQQLLPSLPQQQPPCQHKLKLRLSTTGLDHELVVDSNKPVLVAKEQFSAICKYPASKQRWFCYGRLIESHKRLRDCTIPPDFVIQVIVHAPGESSSTCG